MNNELKELGLFTLRNLFTCPKFDKGNIVHKAQALSQLEIQCLKSDCRISMCEDLGLQQKRLEGEEYVAVLDEFMDAVYTRWPDVIVQVKLQRRFLLHFYSKLTKSFQ